VMKRASMLAALAASVLALAGCPEGSSAGATTVDGGPTPDAATNVSDAAPPATPSSPPPPSSPPTTRAERGSLELLKLTLTSDVQKKEPVDKLDVAKPGTRVYAHLKLRNRTGETRKVRVDFLIDGKLRTPLELEVAPSWSYRTWGYNTIKAGDAGELEVRVYDDDGATITTARLPIAAK